MRWCADILFVWSCPALPRSKVPRLIIPRGQAFTLASVNVRRSDIILWSYNVLTISIEPDCSKGDGGKVSTLNMRPLLNLS